MQARNTDLKRRAECGHRFMNQYVDATLEGDLPIEAFWDNFKKLAQDPTTSINIDVQFLPALETSSTPPSDNQSRILRLRILIALCLLSLLFGVSIVIEQLEYSTNIVYRMFIHAMECTPLRSYKGALASCYGICPSCLEHLKHVSGAFQSFDIVLTQVSRSRLQTNKYFSISPNMPRDRALSRPTRC